MFSVLRVIKRNWSIFILIIIVCLSVSFVAAKWQPLGAVRTEIFTTMAAENFGREGDASDAATYFAETVKGWLKNPTLMDQLIEQSGVKNVSLSAHAQERQNLIFDVTASTVEDSEAAARTLLEILTQSINTYNLETKSSFTIVPQGMNTYQLATRSQFIYIFGGLIAGFVCGLFLVFAKESLLGKLSFAAQVSDAVGRDPLMIIHQSSEENHYTFLALARTWNQPFLISAVSSEMHNFMLRLMRFSQDRRITVTMIDGTSDQQLVNYLIKHSDKASLEKALGHKEQKQIDEGLYVQWFDPSKISVETFPEIQAQSDLVCIYSVLPTDVAWLMNKHINTKIELVELGKSNIEDLKLAESFNSDRKSIIVLS